MQPSFTTIGTESSKKDFPARSRRIPSPTSVTDNEALQETLHDTFGIQCLRPEQQQVISSVLQRHNTLAIMPTGAGKSLCYQLPALKLPGLTVVVSPLISLMKDQAGKLETVGLPTTEVNSTLSLSEEASAIESIRHADSEFIFTTPERLSDPDFLATIRHNKISLFVIDEAHCISHWGHDFRPAYLHLGAAITALDHPPVLALTATATTRVIDDIGRQLGIADMRVINTGIYRPNLHYQVITVTSEQEKFTETLRLVQEKQGSGIVYAATVKAVEEVYRALHEAGENATFYHGQLPAKMRTRNQEAFMSGACRIMVATNAFGMGIDKPDIRFVLHIQIPANLEAYYQESGRAGRDGKDADCILLYYAKDKQVQLFFLSRRYPRAEDLGTVYAALQKLAVEDPRIPLVRLEEELPQVPISRLQVSLKLLKDGGLLEQDNKLNYRLTRLRVKTKELTHLVDTYRDKRARDHEALERLVFYAQTGFCRWKVLTEYFSEHVEWTHCGTCDNCRQPPEQALSPAHVRHHAPPVLQPEKKPGPDVGSSVKVAKYGEGRVRSSAGDKVTIEFPDGQSRTFLQSYVEPV